MKTTKKHLPSLLQLSSSEMNAVKGGDETEKPPALDDYFGIVEDDIQSIGDTTKESTVSDGKGIEDQVILEETDTVRDAESEDLNLTDEEMSEINSPETSDKNDETEEVIDLDTIDFETVDISTLPKNMRTLAKKVKEKLERSRSIEKGGRQKFDEAAEMKRKFDELERKFDIQNRNQEKSNAIEKDLESITELTDAYPEIGAALAPLIKKVHSQSETIAKLQNVTNQTKSEIEESRRAKFDYDLIERVKSDLKDYSPTHHQAALDTIYGDLNQFGNDFSYQESINKVKGLYNSGTVDYESITAAIEKDPALYKKVQQNIIRRPQKKRKGASSPKSEGKQSKPKAKSRALDNILDPMDYLDALDKEFGEAT